MSKVVRILLTLLLCVPPFQAHAYLPDKELSQTTVFIDTDIGSDVDDALAILTALGSQEYKIVGISTVNGDTQTRARIVLRVLELAGKHDVPVASGIGTTLLREKQPRVWTKQLKQNLDQLPMGQVSSEHGVDFLIRSIHEHPGLTVVALGPLTNIAVAIIKEPDIITKIGKLVVVGGATGLPSAAEVASIAIDYKSEYNLNSDPEAAQIVFGSGVPIVMSGLKPALEVSVSKDQVENWSKINSPLAQWITRQVNLRLTDHQTRETHLGDVLGITLAKHPEFAQIKQLPIHLEKWGDTLRTVIDPTGAGLPVNVVLSVNKKAFNSYFSQSMREVFDRQNGKHQ